MSAAGTGWPERPGRPELVGLGRFELPTSRLSGVRSNQLSYRPRREPRRFPGNRIEKRGQRIDLVASIRPPVKASGLARS
jgi:hypothetical protein